MRKAPRLTDKEDKGEELLDAGLWGKLQERIPLQCIYEKLSQRDLFRLRLVSKEWNHAALQWILPKPSFVTIAAGFAGGIWDIQYMNGIVTYNSILDKFKFNRRRLRLLNVQTHVPPFEVEGLILCHNPDDLEERGVYNVHTQTWHVIPAGPKQSEILSALGLLVDTSVRPYTFKLIEGNIDFKTQIYDSKSRSWSRTSSWLALSHTNYRYAALEYSCVCNKDNVYISLGTHMKRHRILKYSLEDDKWTKVKSPSLRDSVEYPPPENTLGIWEDRIFITRESYRKRRVTVWELVDFEGEKWVEYARMPKKLYKWLWKFDFDFYDRDQDLGLRSFFCDGYLLVCSWRFVDASADVLALFNMATKVWQKVDLPRGVVAVDEREHETFHDGHDVDEDEDIDEDDDLYEEDDVEEHDEVDEVDEQ